MKAFVPLTDAVLAGLDGTETLVPYRPGLPLASQLNQRIPGGEASQSRCSSSGSPACRPSSAALPALSSST
jgi:hypothetical protein